MRRSTVLWAGMTATVAGIFAAACSSSGGDETDLVTARPDAGSDSAVAADTAPGIDAAPADATIDAAIADAGSRDAADAATADAGSRDAADAADAALPDATIADAGPPDVGPIDAGPPDTGPCQSVGAQVQRSCGVCGQQSALCMASDGGGIEPGAYSYCNGQRDGGCVPGTEPDGGMPCGRCGRQRAVCQTDCTYGFGSCIQPATATCTPGESVFAIGLSCPNAGEGRYGTCGNDCALTYGNCVIEDTWITASVQVGAVASRPMTLTSAQTIAAGASSGTSCAPSTSASITPYQTIVVRNPSAKNLKVSIWNSFGPSSGTSYYDTIMNVFQGETLPAVRGACLGANDTCSSTPCTSGSGLGGISSSAAVTVNAGESLLVYTGCYSSSCTTPTTLVLNVKTEALLP